MDFNGKKICKECIGSDMQCSFRKVTIAGLRYRLVSGRECMLDLRADSTQVGRKRQKNQGKPMEREWSRLALFRLDAGDASLKTYCI